MPTASKKKGKLPLKHRKDKVAPPGKIHGGKGDGKARIICKLHPDPRHYDTHVEAFGGLASVKMNLPERTDQITRVDIYIEKEDRIFQMFDVMSKPALRDEFIHQMQLKTYSDATFEWGCDKKAWEACKDPVEKAVRTFCMYAMSFSGRTPGPNRPGKTDEGNTRCFSASGRRPRRGMAEGVSAFLSKVDHWAPVWVDIIRHWEIVHGDALSKLAKYDGLKTVFYLDPPYLPETRSEGARDTYHECEMTENEHLQLLSLVNTLKGKVLLSGYDSRTYREALKPKKWRILQWKTVKQSGKAGQAKNEAIECIWMNYEPPEPLPKGVKRVY